MNLMRIVCLGVVVFASAAGAAEVAPTPPTADASTVTPDDGVDATGRAADAPMCTGMMHHHTMPTIWKGGEMLMTAVLSLQPMPIDLGNFYAGNWRIGIVATGIEVGLMTAGVVVVAENNDWMHRWGDGTASDEWSRRDRNIALGLLGSYVATKLISTWIALDTMDARHEQPAVSLRPTIDRGGAGVALAWAFR